MKAIGVRSQNPSLSLLIQLLRFNRLNRRVPSVWVRRSQDQEEVTGPGHPVFLDS